MVFEAGVGSELGLDDIAPYREVCVFMNTVYVSIVYIRLIYIMSHHA